MPESEPPERDDFDHSLIHNSNGPSNSPSPKDHWMLIQQATNNRRSDDQMPADGKLLRNLKFPENKGEAGTRSEPKTNWLWWVVIVGVVSLLAAESLRPRRKPTIEERERDAIRQEAEEAQRAWDGVPGE